MSSTGAFAGQVSLDSGGEVFEGVVGLPMAGFHDGQDRFHEAASAG
jgi:hypothetical protein